MLANSETRYGTVAVALHWLIALLIIGMLAFGTYLAFLPRDDASRFDLIQLHKSIGITVIVLAVLRLLWRLMSRVPLLPAHMPAWERFAAHASHFLLYALIIAIPLSGWAQASASPLGIPTIWFGIIEIPHLPGLQGFADQHAVEHQLHEIHEWLGYLMMGLLAIHVGAALKHHYWDRDDVLTRMLPASDK